MHACRTNLNLSEHPSSHIIQPTAVSQLQSPQPPCNIPPMIAAGLSEATTGPPVGRPASATATPVVPVIGGPGGPVPEAGSLKVLVNELLELVVDDQHKGTAGATQYV